jgi:hypothetical protein
MIPRGSGDHHASTSCTPARIGIGNKPCRYADRIVSGARSAPMPTIPSSSAVSAGGNCQSLSLMSGFYFLL